MKQKIHDMAFLIIGSLIFALGINLFVIPSDLGEGGITGLTIILFYIYGWSPGITSFIFNGILLIVGYRFLNRHTIGYTIITVILTSLFLHFTQDWAIPTGDEIFLKMIFGGLFVGVGIGLVIRVGGTTAGTTILASITKKYLGWNISYGLLFFDLLIVLGSYFVIGMEKMLLTIIMLYIGTKAMQFIIEGFNTRKAVTIISDHADEIALAVSTKMDRGVTIYNGTGYYSQAPKKILYIVIGSQEVVRLKRIVKMTDDNAFITIHDVRDVFGEGFRPMDS